MSSIKTDTLRRRQARPSGGLADIIGRENLFPASPSQPQLVLGTNEAGVKLLYPSQ